MEYKSKIKEIADKISSGEENFIILGDNSSGKSDILKEILEIKNCCGDIINYKEKTYYIDSVNRKFNYKQVPITPYSSNSITNTDEKLITTLKTRLNDFNYNLQDTFVDGNIEKYYGYFLTDLNSWLNEFLELQIEIEGINHGMIKDQQLKVNGLIYDKLSNGLQAIMRLFLEILYANSLETKIIIIDEINEFLSLKNEGQIYEFIKDKFSHIRFIVTTHSSDIVANSNNDKVIALTENSYEIEDSKDLDGIEDVRALLKRAFNIKKKEENLIEEIENELRELFNKKLEGIWGDDESSRLINLKLIKLSASEKQLVRDIEEW